MSNFEKRLAENKPNETNIAEKTNLKTIKRQ